MWNIKVQIFYEKKERENLQGLGKEFLDWAMKNTSYQKEK